MLLLLHFNKFIIFALYLSSFKQLLLKPSIACTPLIRGEVFCLINEGRGLGKLAMPHLHPITSQLLLFIFEKRIFIQEYDYCILFYIYRYSTFFVADVSYVFWTLNNFCWLVLIVINFYCLGTLLDGEPIIKLPPKTIRLSKVDFSTEERAFYTNLEADSRSRFKVLLLPFYLRRLQRVDYGCVGLVLNLLLNTSTYQVCYI